MTNVGTVIEGPSMIRPAQSFGAAMMELIRNPEIPADKLQILVEIQRQNIADEAREAYQQAYIDFQIEMPPVDRDGWVDLGQGKGRYPFTTYEQMDKVLRPLLSRHGLGLQFWSSPSELKDNLLVHGELFGHGWQRASSYPVPPDLGPGRNAMQARGSSQSYAKRYIADLLCNIVRKGKDDDARGAMEALIDAAQMKTLGDLIKATNTVEANFLKLMVTGADSLADIRQRDYTRLELALREKASKKRGPAK